MHARNKPLRALRANPPVARPTASLLPSGFDSDLSFLPRLWPAASPPKIPRAHHSCGFAIYWYSLFITVAVLTSA